MLNEQQLDIVENKDKRLAILAVAGSGKCLGENTPVLMYDGSVRKVQDIVTGDLLMGADSKPRRVLSTVKGIGELRRIKPIKGDSWVCNDVHILSLRGTNRKLGEIRNVQCNELEKEIKNGRLDKDWKLWRTGVDFGEKVTNVDPYLIGLWLGDGSVGYPNITTPDKEIHKYLKAETRKNFPELSCKVTYYDKKCPIVRITGIDGKKNRLTQELRKMILSGEKRIHRDYLINNRLNRLKLLAGLLDTDGHYEKGQFEIVTKYAGLNADILFLARSLGFAAYSSEKIGKIKSIGFSGKYYRIIISGEVSEIPTLVKRKQAKKRKQIKRVSVTGFEIEHIGTGDYYGFELDGDRLFVLGDFTVTHNSTTLVSQIEKEINDGVKPHNITAITFTNEACDSIKKKLKKKDISVDYITVKTLHGFCYSIYTAYCQFNDLKRYTPLSDVLKSFSPKFWKLAAVYKGIYNKNVKQFLSYCASCQLNRISPEKALENYCNYKGIKPFSLRDLQRRALDPRAELQREEYNILIYYEYELFKKADFKLDFNDMLIYAVDALENCEKTLEFFRRKIKSLYVDECQDTNAMVISLLQALATSDMRIVFLGDLRQSVYSFQNARPELIIKYVKENNFTEMSLNKNYRSSEAIVKNANKFISHYPKVNLGGDAIHHLDYNPSDVKSIISTNEVEEKHRVINTIQDLIAKGYDYKDIAILYRTNAQAMLLIDWVVSNNIPFVIKRDSASIFSKREMKDIFTYLKLFNMPEKCSVDDIRRIANKPTRYIPNKAYTGITDDQFGRSLINGQYDYEQSLSKLGSELNRLYRHAKDMGLREQIEFIATGVGYVHHWEKYEAADALFDISLYFTCLSALVEEHNTYEKLVKQVNRVRRSLKERNEEEGLNFYSCHASKGLEFKVVIVLGVCDRLYPFKRAVDEGGEAGFEEEARIFYVASTRPIEHLYYSEIIGKFGRNDVFASPFMKQTLTEREELTYD